MANELAQIGVENPVFLATHLPSAGAAMISLGMADELERMVRIAKTYSDWMAAQLGGVRALVEETRDEYETALALHRSVIDTGLPLGQRFRVTVARVGTGRCLLALGRPEEAATELAAARTDAEMMGARRLLDEINELEQGADGVAVPGG
jgi:hypothetical protein